MKDKLNELRRPLKISEIDFRVQSINNGGYATILAYKDARVDMNRLDEVLGIGYWQRDVKLINGVLYGGIGVWNDELQQWVWKWDAGTESNTEKEKGQASDAFKRACFNVGIGRELYDYPLIQVKLNPEEIQEKGGKKYASWNFKLKEWRWMSQFKDGVITFLAAKDQNGNVRFKWGEFDKDIDTKEGSASGSAVVDPHAHEDDKQPPAKVKEESNPSGVLKKKAEPVDDNPEVLQSGHPASFEDDERALLSEEYEKYFKKKPHGRMKNESIRQAIDELLDSLDDEPKDNNPVDTPAEAEQEPAKDETIEDSDLWPYVLEIDNHDDPNVFVVWAKAIVTEYEENPFINDFKELCNDHYGKISK